MKISIICFTGNGAKLAVKLSAGLREQGYEVKRYSKGTCRGEGLIEPIKTSLQEWIKGQFNKGEGIVFIGATGIAVRTIAPFIEDKRKDPAVIVIDEKGKFVIPLLSGHIGGGNELARRIAGLLDAVPVITTATDLNHKFAVDLFAKNNDLYLTRMDYAKEISAAVLEGKQVGFECDFPFTGELHEDLSTDMKSEHGICVSLDEKKTPFQKTLNLIPKIITLGIGCRKNKTMEEIEEVVLKVLKTNHISIHSLLNVATIDLKKEEAGLLKFCDKYGIKLNVYPAEMLEKVQGVFNESEYVRSVTGTGNVCERAALLGSLDGTIIQKKYAENGITVSIVRKDWRVNFE